MGFNARRLMALLLCLCVLLPCFGNLPAFATENDETVYAEDLTGAELFTDISGFYSSHFLHDGIVTWGSTVSDGASMTLEHAGGIGSLYIIFGSPYSSYTITDNTSGTVYTRENAYLHDFVALEPIFGTVPTSVTVTFNSGSALLYELYAFAPGTVPEFVQQWKEPVDGKTDLVLFSTHGDDEHLFFAGILPYYAGELGYQVQVVYLTDHHNNDGLTRMREMLDGLWAVGVDTYPVFGEFPDYYSETTSTTYLQFAAHGYDKDDVLSFVVEQLRRFKPLVAIGHDFAGEYGHGMHMVYADTLAAAIEISNDPTQYPESAERYGVWDVPKTYFHMYAENAIVMDWDQPLESYGGRTAFDVSINTGFQQHKSQIWDFSWYYWGYTKAASLPKYNPCDYGLYRTTVGADEAKNDFFENLTNYAEMARLEEEARLKAEEEARLKAEEEARRKEEEQRAAEEAARLEEEARLKAEAEAEAAAAAREAAERKQKMTLIIAAGILLVTVIAVIIFLKTRRKGKREK